VFIFVFAFIVGVVILVCLEGFLPQNRNTDVVVLALSLVVVTPLESDSSDLNRLGIPNGGEF